MSSYCCAEVKLQLKLVWVLSREELGAQVGSRCLEGNTGALRDVSARMESAAPAVVQMKQFSHFPLRVKGVTRGISPTVGILQVIREFLFFPAVLL